MVRNLILGKNNQQKEDKPRKFMCVHIKKKKNPNRKQFSDQINTTS